MTVDVIDLIHADVAVFQPLVESLRYLQYDSFYMLLPEPIVS